ncbi:MAG: 50S ribosomal protein L25 [Clostridiaceae bacterium]|nr:50S ribosomal protein L25 [Clostridiaceae bacterium]
MSVAMLTAAGRNKTGKNSMVKERRKGNIPAVVYSKGKETETVYLKEGDLERLLSQYGVSTKIAMDIDGERTYTIIKEVQKDIIKNKLLHVDLQTLDENEKFKVTMPIHMINKEKVESSIEIIQFQLKEVNIQTYPKYLPDKVEVDAMKLKEKDSITLQDLNIAADGNIEILDDLNSTIATIVYASKVEEPKEEEVDLLKI